MDTILNDFHANRTRSLMDNSQMTKHRMKTIQNKHDPDRKQFRMDAIPHGHDAEWELTSIHSKLGFVYKLLSKDFLLRRFK